MATIKKIMDLNKGRSRKGRRRRAGEGGCFECEGEELEAESTETGRRVSLREIQFEICQTGVLRSEEKRDHKKTARESERGVRKRISGKKRIVSKEARRRKKNLCAWRQKAVFSFSEGVIWGSSRSFCCLDSRSDLCRAMLSDF